MSEEPLLQVRGLSVGYYEDLHILRDIDLTAREGTITAILGANGTGKSTLLKTIAGFLNPAKGQVLLRHRDITGVPAHRMVVHGVSYIPQHPGIFEHMTVEENVLLGAWSFRRDRARVRQRLAENLARFPALAEYRHEEADHLSGGQRRMVEIARTLMTSPELLLVDEPTAGLAKQVSADVYAMLCGLRDDGMSIVLVDQEIRDAIAISDHIYVLDLGRNRFDGPPSEFADLRKALWS